MLYTDEALVELETLIDYIRADSPGSAERFGTALLNHVELLREFPRLGLPVSKRLPFEGSCILLSGFTTAYLTKGR